MAVFPRATLSTENDHFAGGFPISDGTRAEAVNNIAADRES